MESEAVTATAESNSEKAAEDRYYTATQTQLIIRAFKKHKPAVVSAFILFLFYVTASFAEFLSPYGPFDRYSEFIHAPPTKIHFVHNGSFSLRPFVYRQIQVLDMETLQRFYEEDKSEPYYIKFFTRSVEYKMWSLFDGNLHLFGVEQPAHLFLFGTDELGRDMFSRIVFASRISLSIGFVGVILSFVLGATLGAISGYFGGVADAIIQRIIELLRSIPTIPLWMGLAAAVPPDWTPIMRYFAITVILSLVAWTGLARVVRGKFLELREEEFIMAARLAGTGTFKIILTHMFPGFISYLIVNATLAVPRMILAETSLSFLGLGLRPPVVSWGVLLQKAQNVRTMAIQPWLLIPVIFVIVTVLLFSFIGDGLRDAADPYKSA